MSFVPRLELLADLTHIIPFPVHEAIPVPASDGEHIIIYTDGACKSNGTGLAVAGYGVFFGPNDLRNRAVPLEGSVQTNNRAELQAV